MADYRIDGQGLLDKGLTPDGAVVDGIGLLTFGFVFSCFSPFVYPSGVTATVWAQSAGVTMTSWTGATGPMFGPC